MASSVKRMKRKIKRSNYKDSWLLECNNIDRPVAEKLMNVRWCLEHGADANVMSSSGYAALHAATRCAEADLVHLLIKHGADVNKVDRNGETPLHLAVRFGDGTAHILEPLAPEEIENLREDDTPQLQAAHSKEVHIVDMLLVNADTNITDKFGDTPLHVAVRSGEASVVLLLLQYSAEVNISNSTGDTPLHLAAHRGEAPIVEALLSRKAGVNTTNSANNSPLHLAAHRGEESVVQMLLASDADVTKTNSDGDTPLHMATRSGKTEVAVLLLKPDAVVNTKNNAGYSPLHVAAESGMEDIVKLLLQSDADVNATNNAGNTALHLAVLHGQAAILVLLLDNGVNVDIENSAGDTSLYLAVLHGDPATVELLLKCGAKPNTISSHGNAPLHVAAYLGKSLIADLLLNFKADVNSTDKGGNTPLHLAARRQHARVVRLLLQRDADVSIRNSDWNTPLTVARVFHFEGNEEVVSLLRNAEKLSDPLALSNSGRLQTPSYITESNSQVAIKENNFPIDSPFNNLQADTSLMYPRTTDTAGLAGQLYEIKLLSLVLIRAINDEKIKDFLLGTNIHDVGDMDDICLRYKLKDQVKSVMLFVQAKHKEDRVNTRLTVEDLWIADGDFSLQKYLDSYLTIKDRFQVGNENPMFDGEFKDVECNFVIYTPAIECFTKKKTEHQVSAQVDFLINTADDILINPGDKTEAFQYDYDKHDIERLTKMTVIKQFKKSGAVFLEMIMSEKEKWKMILNDKRIARYHVVMGREVLKLCTEQEDKEYRMWEFRSAFFTSNNEYLLALKRTFVKELSTKRCDQSKIAKEDQDNFKLVLENPCAATISKLIGKLALVNDKTKKLQLIEVDAFKKKFKTVEFKKLTERFNNIQMNENDISEAVQIKLASLKFKLPLSFGNLDMTFRGNAVKVERRITAVVKAFISFLEKKLNTDTMILDISDDVVGPGKIIEQGIIDINGGIGSAVGTLLVLDPVTNLLKFDLAREKLPKNASLFLNELNLAIYKPVNEKLSSYRFKNNVDGFPKDSLSGDEYDTRQARDFLSKLWFYSNQAKQDEVEQIVKNEIDKYYNNEKDDQIKFKIHSDAIFRSAYAQVAEWWKEPSEAKYLNRNKGDFFQKSKLDCFNNLLLTVMYHIYESKVQNIDFKFNPLVQESDACIQASAAFDIVFGQKFKIFEKQKKRIDSDGNQKIKDLVQYAEKLANFYVAASSDLSMMSNILGNKEGQGNIVINILQNNVEQQFEVNEFKYSKRSGTSDMSGQLYETKLLCLVLIRMLNDEEIEDFFLGTNIRDIGVMDDICLRYRMSGIDKPIALFLQAKHKEKGNLTIEDMRHPKGEFSLRKYFESYLNIRNRVLPDSEDSMFQGDFGKIDWNFIIYTPAKHNLKKKKTEKEVSKKVHYLIKTHENSEHFQFEHDKTDTDLLTKVIVTKRLTNLGVVFLKFILFDKDELNSILTDKLIAQYHVVMGREVLQPCGIQQADNQYRMWEFRPEFLKNDVDEYLDTLKKTLVNELSTKCWNQFKITDEDRDNFMLVLKEPCASTISKLIGKLAIYNTKTKKLQLVADFREELKSNATLKMLAEQFNEIEITEHVIGKAIQIKLEAMAIKLPLSFGNIDMTLPRSEINIKGKITEMADTFMKLLELNKDTKIVDITDVIDPEKNTEHDFIDVYGYIVNAFGNLLVFDPETKMLKLDLNNETLPDNAALFLKELKENKYKPLNEDLTSFRIKVSLDTFTKDSFYGDEHDESQAKDFLSKLWLYTNQANQGDVELKLKDEINEYYAKIGHNCSTFCSSLQDLIFLSSHDDVQKWWIQTSQSPYLTRASELFERAKEAEICNLLETVINFMYISNTSSLDIKFKQSVSKYFKFVKMHQIFNKMSGILFSLFEEKFYDSINIELPDIEEPMPYSNYSSLGELVFSLEIHHNRLNMEWVAMKMWSVSTFTQYFLLAKASPAQGHRRARDSFMLKQLCNGRFGQLIEGERDPDEIYSFVNTTRFN